MSSRRYYDPGIGNTSNDLVSALQPSIRKTEARVTLHCQAHGAYLVLMPVASRRSFGGTG